MSSAVIPASRQRHCAEIQSIDPSPANPSITGLPDEILLQIARLLLYQPEGIVNPRLDEASWPRARRNGTQDTIILHAALVFSYTKLGVRSGLKLRVHGGFLPVCKRFYMIGCEVLYRENVFIFSDAADLIRFSLQAPNATARIRSIRLEFPIEQERGIRAYLDARARAPRGVHIVPREGSSFLSAPPSFIEGPEFRASTEHSLKFRSLEEIEIHVTGWKATHFADTATQPSKRLGDIKHLWSYSPSDAWIEAEILPLQVCAGVNLATWGIQLALGGGWMAKKVRITGMEDCADQSEISLMQEVMTLGEGHTLQELTRSRQRSRNYSSNSWRMITYCNRYRR